MCHTYIHTYIHTYAYAYALSHSLTHSLKHTELRVAGAPGPPVSTQERHAGEGIEGCDAVLSCCGCGCVVIA